MTDPGRGPGGRTAAAVLLASALVAACVGEPPTDAADHLGGAAADDVVEPEVVLPSTDVTLATPPAPVDEVAGPEATALPEPEPTRVPTDGATAPPDGFRQRRLDVTATGLPALQEVPPEYVDRRLVTVDNLPPPPTVVHVATIEPIPEALVATSTWREGCPITLDELRYLTVSLWGFDELHHTGELGVHRDAAEDLVGVFEKLHAARFPLEAMELITPVDFFEFHRAGDDNVTAADECRAAAGSGSWSQHACGRAININPFHNPYAKQESAGFVVLPAYASAYLDRDRDVPGAMREGDVIVAAIDAIGWGWGGRWNSLKDWQHFSARGT